MVRQIPGQYLLLQFNDKDERHRGEYKTVPNNIKAFDEDGNSVGIMYETTSPFDTPRRMEKLIDWLDQTLNEKSIHPFQDGNGRLSRILTILALLQAGYAYVPYCSLESIVEQNKDGYYLALRRTQGTIYTAKPDWQPWVELFLMTLQKHKSKLQEKVEQEKILVGTLPELSLKIVEIARERGRVTVSEAVKVTQTSRNTIKDHLKSLVGQGHLTKHGDGRGTWYSVR